MLDEEKKDGIIDDTDLEPIIDEEVKVDEEKVDEENWEERYKNLQSQTDKQVADMQKSLKKHQDLTAPFSKNIKENEDGSLKFDFSETPQKPKEAPPQPTEDDWVENPKEAAEKLYAYKEYQRDQKEAKKQDSKAAEDADTVYKKQRAEAWGSAQKIYPDAQDENSDLFKRADAILKADPAMTASPHCDLMAMKIAAAELGISPVKSQEKPKEDKTSYIIGGKGAGGGSKGNKDTTDAEFDNLPDDQQRQLMKKQILSK